MRTLFAKIKKYFPSKVKKFIRNEVRIADRQGLISNYVALPDKLNYSSDDIECSKNLLKCRNDLKPKSIAWLIPGFRHPFGGMFTILRVANYLNSIGYINKLVIYDKLKFSVDEVFQAARKYFPKIDLKDFLHINNAVEQEVPQSDVAIGTFWTSCFPLLKIRNTKHKIYFIQDFEPLFYSSGIRYALCEDTYRLPFNRIINSKGLYDYINGNYEILGIKSCYFTPGVDDRFKYIEKSIDNIVRVFFYARPSESRNGFELGMNFLKRIKERYRDKVDIVCAGQSFDFKELGLNDVSNYLSNIGTLRYEELPSFYNSFHIGISFMFTKHPSYIPLELMKSGCLVFANHNEANLWLFKNDYNCIMSQPSINIMMERFDALINDSSKYLNIVKNAYKTVKEFTWESALNNIAKFISEL